MSRSGYTDEGDCDNLGLWRASIARATRGKRGQAFLHEMAAALDAMPVKELIAGEVVREDNQVCAIGSVALARGLKVTELDVYDGDAVGKTFGIAQCLAREIAFENDDDFGSKTETPAERWRRMRTWVASQLIAPVLMKGTGEG